ncbi:MAG: ion transporter [Bacteroidota bacterium]
MLKRIFFDDRIIFSAILFNAVVIFCLAFPEMADNRYLWGIDEFFIAFFLVEAMVKIYFLKPSGYFKDNWNVFDFVLVVGSLPAILANFVDIPYASFLLVFRLFRLLRLVKFLTFIPNMKHLLEGLGRAFKASVFVILALFLLNFILAVLTVHLFGKAAPQYFQDPLIASYTIFQMFTVEGWNEIPAVVAEYYGGGPMAGFTRIYFVIVVLLGGIFGMSLANAIFVDEMTIDNNVVLEKKIDTLQEQINQLQKLLEDRS